MRTSALLVLASATTASCFFRPAACRTPFSRPPTARASTVRAQRALPTPAHTHPTPKAEGTLHEQLVAEDVLPPSSDAAGVARLEAQLAEIDTALPGGGLVGYVRRAKTLLKEAAEGVNSLDGWTPSIPVGVDLVEYGDAQWQELEQRGLEEASRSAFVIVAGGLGERLGFNGIKLALETQTVTGQGYLEYYLEWVLALQTRARKQIGASGDLEIPVLIMTSDDTHEQTAALVAELTARMPGVGATQIELMKQPAVPALSGVDAKIALDPDDPHKALVKPHGHGDVHSLLAKHGIAQRWHDQGARWVLFLQDTNALVTNAVLPTLGATARERWHFSTIATPRAAGEAAGALARLEHSGGEPPLTCNVEYNQLEPLLRATLGKGDEADPQSGYSPFPGNTNSLCVDLSSYVKVLDDTGGTVPEFVNPKWKDDSRTTFKKPARLECMMQDFPRLLAASMGDDARIGFISFPRWLAFSPAKNDRDSGAALAKGGSPGSTAASAENDLYSTACAKMALVGAAGVALAPAVDEDPAGDGYTLPVGPRLSLSHSWAITAKEVSDKARGAVAVSRGSTVLLDGEGIYLDDVEVDGALSVTAGPGVRISLDGLKVKNAGWAFDRVAQDAADATESEKIRGYSRRKVETAEIVVMEPGDYVVGADGQPRAVDRDVGARQ